MKRYELFKLFERATTEDGRQNLKAMRRSSSVQTYDDMISEDEEMGNKTSSQMQPDSSMGIRRYSTSRMLDVKKSQPKMDGPCSFDTLYFYD